MNSLRMQIGFLLWLPAALVFSEQPTLKSAEVIPGVASRGDTVKIVVEFTGNPKELKKVSFVVREYQEDYPKVFLMPIENSDANVWASIGPVPYDAPFEIVHLDIQAVDSSGQEIVSKGFENQPTGRTGTMQLQILER